MAAPIWQTPAGFLGTLTERKTTSTTLVATGTNVSYSLITGSLPVGLYLSTSTGQVFGTPGSVAVVTDYTFVIRAKNTNGASDRTFSFSVTGPNAPVWVTPGGALPTGLNGEFFSVNKEYVNYSLRAETDILRPGSSLKFYIADNDGQLPPGLKLSEDGRITGYVKDDLTIDASATIEGGYDTEAYDRYPYEHNAVEFNISNLDTILGTADIVNIIKDKPAVITTEGPHGMVEGQRFVIKNLDPLKTGMANVLNGNVYYAKIADSFRFYAFLDQAFSIPLDTSTLGSYNNGGGIIEWGGSILGKPEYINKIYQFYVTVTDGISSSRRLFNIEVVDPDTLRADTTAISVDTNIFDASVGNLLAPLWVSKYGDRLPSVHNLGYVRGSRQQILTIYDYDPYPAVGPTIFDWNFAKVNPDIKLITDSVYNAALWPTKNLKGDTQIYFKDAELFPVKGMKIRLNEWIPNLADITYTVTGVIPLSKTTGILNLDQPLSQQLPDERLFYVGTESIHPPGLSLDPTSGNLYGQIQYQPTYSSSYRFTIQVVKIDQESGSTTLYDTTGDDTGRITGKVYYESNQTTLPLLPEDLPGVPYPGNPLPNPTTYTGKAGDIILVGISQQVDEDLLLPLMDGTNYAYVFSGNRDVTGSIITPYWGYLGKTVISKQIYLLTILGDIPSAIQWVSTSSLGALIPREISEIQIKAVNTNTNYDIQYELISGKLPPGLTLNADGTVQGKIITIGQTTFDSKITTSTFVGSIVNNILYVDTVISGEVTRNQFLTAEGLTKDAYIVNGSDNKWTVSTNKLTTNKINFVATTTFTGTTLSPNAYSKEVLTIDGGKTSIDRNWYFTVRASDAYRLSAVDKEFYITINTDDGKNYTRIFVRPFLLGEKRILYKSFVTDPIIFDPALIYRPNDPEFGIQTQIKMIVETSLETVDTDYYAEAMQQYFYRKSFYFGEIKSVLAKDKFNNSLYEIVYAEIVDDQMIGNLYTTTTNSISIANMQIQLESIVLADGQNISVNERLQPKYMTTIQSDTGLALGFIRAVPICYVKPGGAVKILSRIKASGFDLKQIHFDTDRIVVESTLEAEKSQWLAYPTDRR